jgi:hypothetical protein
MAGLQRRDDRIDALHSLREQAQTLAAHLEDREDRLRQLSADLHVFKVTYHRRVGVLHEQLDELAAAIAEAEIGELSKLIDEAGSPRPASPSDGPSAPPRLTSDAIRKLFRDVAKIIHPDLARDADALGRRHALMAEANRAYADGDEAQLRLILESWERSPEAVQGHDPTAQRLRLTLRIEQLEARLAGVERELDEIEASPVSALKAKVDEAAVNGRDLIAEMVKRLERDVLAATNRLAAMRS